MQRIPSWSYALTTILLIVLDLSLGAGGSAGRAWSRVFYWPLISIGVATTFFAYLAQYRHPTSRLWLVNLSSVVYILFVTLPVWHFGVELVPGGAPIFRWWVNPLVLGLGILIFLTLQILTRPIRDTSSHSR